MSVLDEYPKTCRNATAQLRNLLERVSASDPKAREELARAINGIADKARDLEDIFQRLTQGPADPSELADLLVAFELTLEQIRGDSDVLDGKLYEMADRLRS
jgi:hypothetical protein